MKVAGIITEYNPFHNGHKHHIEETKRVTGADYIIAVMSGNFVQRGTPALMDKYSRTKMALNNGVDLVFELPACFAVGSAEYFATGAVSLLNQLGIVDTLCFGSECGDINQLVEAADLLLEAPDHWEEKLYSYIKEGFTYPAARFKAMAHNLDSPEDSGILARVSAVLSEPNNILGLEYIKAIKKLSSSIQPMTINRRDAHYHEMELTDRKPEASPVYQLFPTSLPEPSCQNGNVISSATAIRRTLFGIDSIFDLNVIKNSVPMDVYEFMMHNYFKSYPITEEDFSQIIKYKLLTENRNSLMDYVDISSDLADRMSNLKNTDRSMANLIKSIKTKNITHTRVNRAFAHLLLNIKTADFQEYCRNGYTFYGRVLGFRKESSHLLRRISIAGQIPVITKVAGSENQLDALGRAMLSNDIFASHLYNQAIFEKFGTSIPNEYKHGVCIL